jgi:hypothetical protein
MNSAFAMAFRDAAPLLTTSGLLVHSSGSFRVHQRLALAGKLQWH